MDAANNQPDWGEMAEKFDIWLPQLASVGLRRYGLIKRIRRAKRR